MTTKTGLITAVTLMILVAIIFDGLVRSIAELAAFLTLLYFIYSKKRERTSDNN